MDTSTIERVLRRSRPVDHTTLFSHEPTALCPCPRRPPSTVSSAAAVSTPASPRCFTACTYRAPRAPGHRGLSRLLRGLSPSRRRPREPLRQPPPQQPRAAPAFPLSAAPAANRKVTARQAHVEPRTQTAMHRPCGWAGQTQLQRLPRHRACGPTAPVQAWRPGRAQGQSSSQNLCIYPARDP